MLTSMAGMPPATADGMASYLSLAGDVRAAPVRTSAYLSAAGFGDIPRDGPLVLGALTVSSYRTNELLEKAGIQREQASRIIGVLVERGYLHLRHSPGDNDCPMIAMTERGRALMFALRECLLIGRWADFPFRDGDIVISATAGSGTTWMQMICALLVFHTLDFPEPLRELSLWPDKGLELPRDQMYAQASRQKHRRFMKSHMPMNDIPAHSGLTYIVVARHPLDAAISHYHLRQEVNRVGTSRRVRQSVPSRYRGESPHEWLLRWIGEEEVLPRPRRGSLPGVLWHLSDAWAQREKPNVILVHYENLSADLETEMRRLAARLGIHVPETIWPMLVKAATFKEMHAAANRLQPDSDLIENPAASFRTGISGSGRELLSSAELARYHAYTALLARPDLLAWLHRQG
jgi:aryl sulfotransferase